MRLGRSLPPRDARGQVMVLVALLFVTFMAFSAFVFDVGAAYLERRQDVTAADGGALAGAASLLQMSSPNKDLVGRNAVDVARLNIRPLPSVAAWNDQFAACTDPERNLTEYPTGNNYRPLLSDGRYTDCVHFNASFSRIRVRIPDQSVKTTFARVLGIDQLNTHAVAEARVTWSMLGRSIPFSLKNGEGNPEDLLCVRLDGNCQGPTNQATRVLDSPFVGNLDFGTTQSCGSMWSLPGDSTPDSTSASSLADLGARAANNAASGLDHVVVVRAAGPPVEPARLDDCGPRTPLPRQTQLAPNWVYATQFDNLASNSPLAAKTWVEAVASGLFFGGTFADGGPPRLQRFPGAPSQWLCASGSVCTRTLTRGLATYVVDDRPLWDYITPGINRVGHTTCNRESFNVTNPGDPQNTGPTIGHMVICLRDWDPGDPPLFDLDSNGDGIFDIQGSPRTGVFPVVGVPGNTNYPPSPVLGFQTGFIQTLYLSSTTSCPCAEYEPGKDPGNLNGKNAVGMSVFRIEDAMLPLPARPVPGGRLPGTTSLIR